MKKVTIQDISVIGSFYKKSGSELGYNSFSGTYATALGHHENLFYEIISKDIFCYIIADEKDKSVIPLFANGVSKEKVRLFKDYCVQNNVCSGIYIDSTYVPFLEEHFSLQETETSEHEVIYPVERFKSFASIDTQKRRANIFFRNNTYEFIPYENQYKSGVLELIDQWEKTSKHPTDSCDNIIARFFTDNYNALPVLGFLLLINNKVEACLFGEIINHKTFVIYLVKGSRDIKGIYQALYHLVCTHALLEDVQYINGTNLTDVQGLRESKLRLKPSKMITPWTFDVS